MAVLHQYSALHLCSQICMSRPVSKCVKGCFYVQVCCTKSISSETPSPRMLGALCFSTWTSTSHKPYKYCCTINITTHHINISISRFAMVQKNHGRILKCFKIEVLKCLKVAKAYYIYTVTESIYITVTLARQ